LVRESTQVVATLRAEQEQAEQEITQLREDVNILHDKLVVARGDLAISQTQLGELATELQKNANDMLDLEDELDIKESAISVLRNKMTEDSSQLQTAEQASAELTRDLHSAQLSIEQTREQTQLARDAQDAAENKVVEMIQQMAATKAQHCEGLSSFGGWVDCVFFLVFCACTRSVYVFVYFSVCAFALLRVVFLHRLGSTECSPR
jgi:chromosome segregation ATPase